jgi:hypothetical protein
MKLYRNPNHLENVVFLFNNQLTQAASQRGKLLAALHRGPVSTLKARAELDVLHPAARIKELRKRGYEITTQWVTEDTVLGKHKVAQYVLLLNRDMELRQVA